MSVVGPQVDQYVLQQYALEQQFLFVLFVRAKVVLLQVGPLRRERQRLAVDVWSKEMGPR